MQPPSNDRRGRFWPTANFLAGLILGVLVTFLFMKMSRGSNAHQPLGPPHPGYAPRGPVDSSGYSPLMSRVPRWRNDASLAEIADAFRGVAGRGERDIDRMLASGVLPDDAVTSAFIVKSTLLLSEGKAKEAHDILEDARGWLAKHERLSNRMLYSVIFLEGVAAMRRGENDNCVMCRGDSSCILPIVPAARHANPTGSRLAIKYFTEYLDQFPNDLEVRWLLNVAHMTLGEYPEKVDTRYLLLLDGFFKSEFDIGRFRDVADVAGVNRFNQAGGALMEDFDNDGRLDLAVTSFDPLQRISLYHNQGDGTFEDRADQAGVAEQLGGLFCVQTDYDNDGKMDIYIPRGAWLHMPMPPSLLRNKGDGTFEDVTKRAGLLDPVNSNSATWADYDNDGRLDLFVCCEQQANRLYHNEGDGTFKEVAANAGLEGLGRTFCKGAAWIDFDNDRYPDIFLNYLNGNAVLYHNDRDGTFTNVSATQGIDGPQSGFSCWAFDYDNDGWLDIFATCYDRTLKDVVKGLIGEPHALASNRLFRNLGGKGFRDVTREAGLDMVFAAMGSNFADFDNDGFLDFYLATGEPSFATLIPNRMLKNINGKRFSEITGSTGTGHLQKGHAVACGDYDGDGDVDLFVQTGGAVDGDKFHNLLFQNPGQGNHQLTVKLVGRRTNRAAVGARIKVVVGGAHPREIHRHVSSGSSFGANPLRQSFGLAKDDHVDVLEVYWPTSNTTQVFRDIPADQTIEITEFESTFRQVVPTSVARAK